MMQCWLDEYTFVCVVGLWSSESYTCPTLVIHTVISPGPILFRFNYFWSKYLRASYDICYTLAAAHVSHWWTTLETYMSNHHVNSSLNILVTTRIHDINAVISRRFLVRHQGRHINILSASRMVYSLYPSRFQRKQIPRL